jgi:hypothetical protein
VRLLPERGSTVVLCGFEVSRLPNTIEGRLFRTIDAKYTSLLSEVWS